MRSEKELNELKTAYETLIAKLRELSEDELSIVTGGVGPEENVSARNIDIRARGIGYDSADKTK